jgi:hypothetical protein
MTAPVRIQRMRTRGWRLPVNTICVSRPSIWGNPFIVGHPCGVFPEGMGHQGKTETLVPALTLVQCVEFYDRMVNGMLSPEMYPFGHDWSRTFHKRHGQHPADFARHALRGHHLACWCALDKPCHADVLLEIANA